jgi:hypothetical protein
MGGTGWRSVRDYASRKRNSSSSALSQPDLRTPWRNAVNWSTLKNNQIGERVNVKFRGEFYNVFNQPQFEVSAASPT